MPIDLFVLLKEQLPRIAMGQEQYVQLTRRSPLHFYGDMTSLNFSSTMLGIVHTEIHGTFEEGTETLWDEILPFGNFVNLRKRELQNSKYPSSGGRPWRVR
jgi:hypothetical protein